MYSFESGLGGGSLVVRPGVPGTLVDAGGEDITPESFHRIFRPAANLMTDMVTFTQSPRLPGGV